MTLHTSTNPPPQNVGILAAEVYIPRTFVSQVDLEKKDGCEGKYTIGLGLQKMGFCSAREDINSISLTVVESLLKKYNISHSAIGRIEVGTETIIDKSKSIKTTLMSLFEESGNTDVAGIDTTNACYGGTNALLNAIHWVESSWWDGRYALVVASDIAIYAEGPARPTGGCGAVALLIGPNAPIIFNSDVYGHHSEDVYDFYKPANLITEYPLVDGHLSILCYMRSLDICYQRFKTKYALKHGNEFDISKADFALFHAPYSKLVTKAYARLLWNDYLGRKDNKFVRVGQLVKEKKEREEKATASPTAEVAARVTDKLSAFLSFSDFHSYSDRDLEKSVIQLTDKDFKEKIEPSMSVSRQVGNLYTASVYASLISLISNVEPSQLAGKNILLYSYGSGLQASLLSLTIRDPDAVKQIADKASLKSLLSERIAVSVERYTDILKEREELLSLSPNAITEGFNGSWPENHLLDLLRDGTYYLSHIDSKLRRYYLKK